MQDIRLLAIDLDGTLVGATADYFKGHEFRERIDKLRSQFDAKWVVCTGRSRRGFRHCFSPLLELGIQPDFLVTKDAYIFVVTPNMRFIPNYRWNLLIRRKLVKHEWMVNAAFDEWGDFFQRWDFGIVETVRTRRRLAFYFDSVDAAGRAFELLRSKAARFPYIRVRRYPDAISAELDMFSKGLAVCEIAAEIGASAEYVLAIGDGRNDICMMEPMVAKLMGCPGNARSEVMEAVHVAGGHIAKARHLAGAVEVLDAYLTGSICSDLPTKWRPYASPGDHGDNFMPLAKRWMLTVMCILIGLIILTVILFADFGLLPHSGAIMRSLKLGP